MTTEKAIKWLIGERDNNICGLKYVERREALNMAIQALKQMKEGHWIKKPYLEPLPMDCLPPNLEDYDEETHSLKSYKIVCDKCGWEKDIYLMYKFCPNCGSKNGVE